MLRTVRNVALSVFALALLFTGAGVLYVLLSDNETKNAAVLPDETPDKSQELFKPRKPNPKAPVGASVSSLITPVKAGSNTSITVSTTPTASCKITVKYNELQAKDSGLLPKKADDFGNVSWTWTVDRSAPTGKWPVEVECTYNKRSGVVQGILEVKN